MNCNILCFLVWTGGPLPYCDKIPTFMGSSKANLVLVNFEKKLGLCILVGSGRGVNRKHHPAERCDLRFAG